MMSSKKITRFIAVVVCLFIFSAARAQTETTPVIDSLPIFRHQIDSLDYQIIALLGQRMKVVEEVGGYKARNNIPVLQQKRFDAILQKNIALGKQVNLSEVFITELMNTIHKESLAKEEELKKINQ